MKKKLKAFLSKVKAAIIKSFSCVAKYTVEYIGDFLILSGLSAIIGVTFSLNIIAGWYTTGAILFSLGIFFTYKKGR